MTCLLAHSRLTPRELTHLALCASEGQEPCRLARSFGLEEATVQWVLGHPGMMLLLLILFFLPPGPRQRFCERIRVLLERRLGWTAGPSRLWRSGPSRPGFAAAGKKRQPARCRRNTATVHIRNTAFAHAAGCRSWPSSGAFAGAVPVPILPCLSPGGGREPRQAEKPAFGCTECPPGKGVHGA